MPLCPANCTGCLVSAFWASPNLFVYAGKLLNDRESAGKLWGFDLNLMKMQGCCLFSLSAAGTHRGGCKNGCCEFAAVVCQNQVCLSISIYRGVNAARLRCCHSLWWLVCCFGGGETDATCQSPWIWQELSLCHHSESHGNEGPEPLLPWLMTFNYQDHNCCVFPGMLWLCWALGIPFGCPGMRLSDGHP